MNISCYFILRLKKIINRFWYKSTQHVSQAFLVVLLDLFFLIDDVH